MGGYNSYMNVIIILCMNNFVWKVNSDYAECGAIVLTRFIHTNKFHGHGDKCHITLISVRMYID